MLSKFSVPGNCIHFSLSKVTSVHLVQRKGFTAVFWDEDTLTPTSVNLPADTDETTVGGLERNLYG